MERNSVYILWPKEKSIKFKSPGWLKMQKIDSAKVQRWSFMFWGLFRGSLILQPSVVRGEWRTCSLQMWLYLFCLADRREALCQTASWKHNSYFCRRWATAQRPESGLSRTGCPDVVILWNCRFPGVNLLNESVSVWSDQVCCDCLIALFLPILSVSYMITGTNAMSCHLHHFPQAQNVYLTFRLVLPFSQAFDCYCSQSAVWL